MPNVNNASIRYLMKEMDPSEELLMEREMLEDEDLLIEVESMRSTLQRLNKDLPLVDPPAGLTNKIVEQAANREKLSRGRVGIAGLYRFHYTAAAAVVILGLLSGLVWLQTDGTGSTASVSSEHDTSPSSASISSAPSTNPSSSQQLSSTQTSSGTESSGQGGAVEPWVDNNEIIRFQDQFADENRAAFDSIMNNSTQKLTPIEDDLIPSSSSTRSLRLTGSD